MDRAQPHEQWLTDAAAVVAAVTFDPQPIDGLDRLTELIIATDALPGSARRHLSAARAALASRTPLANLVPQPHSEGAIRKLLRALAVRLEQWIEDPPAVTRLAAAEWDPGPAADVVGRLEREPAFFERWLRSPFDSVADPAGDLKLAVLRLASGSVVALVQVVGNPTPGVTLLQPGVRPRPRGEVLREFLADCRLPDGVVGSRVRP